MTPLFSRLAIAVLVVLAIVLLAGTTYQGVATALERRDFPRPGARVNVGGHQLHINCTGQGRPAVILEAPETGMSEVWAWVQPEVARLTRVCSYDRAGLGWSEAGDLPFDPQHVPTELHALLGGAHVPSPYVLVGESLGAAFVRMYVARYPTDVVGTVLIDDPAPAAEQAREELAAVRAFGRFIRYAPWLARIGILRATRMLSSDAEGLPTSSAGAVGAFLNRPDHLTRAGHELARWDETLTLARQAPVPDGLPLRAVQAGSSGPGAFLARQAEATKVTAEILAIVRQARLSASAP